MANPEVMAPANDSAVLQDIGALMESLIKEGDLSENIKDIIRKLALDSGKNASYVDMFLDDDVIFTDDIDSAALTYMKQRKYIIGSLLSIISILGVLANVFVIISAILKNKRHPSAFRLLLVNLTCACLLFLVGGLPLLMVTNIFGGAGGGWIHGETMCQFHHYLIYTSFYAVAYSILLLLVHQLLALYAPDWMVRYDSPAVATICSATLWVLLLLCNIPNYMDHGVDETIPGFRVCAHKGFTTDPGKVKPWIVIQFVFTFAVPFLIMCVLAVAIMTRICALVSPSGAYNRLYEADDIRKKREMAILAIAITISFAICWGPDKLFGLCLIIRPVRVSTPIHIVSDILMVLAYANPSVNPFIIIFSTVDVKQIIQRCTARMNGKYLAGSTDASPEPIPTQEPEPVPVDINAHLKITSV